MGRFTLPLCYNFLQVLSEEHSSLTVFVGKLNLLPILGNAYTKIFPSVFGLILVCKLLNVHGRFLAWSGFIPEQSGGNKWKSFEIEGKKIIYKEKLLVLSHYLDKRIL